MCARGVSVVLGSEGAANIAFLSCNFEDDVGRGLHVEGETLISLSDCDFRETGTPAACLLPLSHGEVAGSSFCGNTFDDACPCSGDANGDGHIDVPDSFGLLAAFGSSEPDWDLKGSGVVDVSDLLGADRHVGALPSGEASRPQRVEGRDTPHLASSTTS